METPDAPDFKNPVSSDAPPRITRPDASSSISKDPGAAPFSGTPGMERSNILPDEILRKKKEKRNKRKHPVIRTLVIVFAFLLILLAGGATLGYWYYYLPSTAVSTAAPARVILYDAIVPEADYRWDGTSLLLSCSFVKANLDPSLYWEESGKVIVTTADKVIEMSTGELTAYVNSKPVSIHVPVTIYDKVLFVPIDFLSSIYGCQIDKLDSGITVIDDLKKSFLSMEVKEITIMNELAFLKDVPYLGDLSYLKDTPYLREAPSFRSPRISLLSPGDLVIVVGEENNWYKVRSSGGILGYIKKSQVALKEIIPARQKETVSATPWKPVGGKINLTWDYMSAAKNDMSKYTAIPGLNVISPTWFSLADKQGSINNLGSVAYVKWAHEQGLQVWALCSNGFDPELTTPVLRSYELRKKFIQQLLVFADSYGFDGINLDFENINYTDKDYLTQFVRELTPYMHEQGLTVSMDMTVRSANENWSMVYDRVALAKTLDYVAVMTYDEHWRLSPESGSVASLPWVEEGVARMLEQIPKEKLLLGVPFYTRLWTETTQADGTVKVTSEALSMAAAKKWINGRNIQLVQDDTTGQNYGTFTDGVKTYKIWVEDEYSMRQRIRLVKKYSLPGVASWRKGFEESVIWDVIKEELARMP